MQTTRVSGRFTSGIGVNYTTSNKRWNLGCKMENLLAKHSKSTQTINPYIIHTENSQVAVTRLLLSITYRFQAKNKIETSVKKITTENRGRL